MATTDLIKLNVGSGPHRAPAPWWNIDLVENDQVRPDQVVPRGVPLRKIFGVGSCSHVMLGHVMEHVPWMDVPAFLDDITDVLVPGGEVCVIGPDVHRMIIGWHEGREPWSIVRSGLEDSPPQEALGDWPEARHSWNAYEERVAGALTNAKFVDVTCHELIVDSLPQWPIVSYAPWQCLVTARTASR